MFNPRTSVIFSRSTWAPAGAHVVGYSQHGDAHCSITFECEGKTVLHDWASVHRLSRPRVCSAPPAQSEASSSTGQSSGQLSTAARDSLCRYEF